MQPDDLEGHGSDIVEVMLAYDHCGGANMTKVSTAETKKRTHNASYALPQCRGKNVTDSVKPP